MAVAPHIHHLRTRSTKPVRLLHSVRELLSPACIYVSLSFVVIVVACMCAHICVPASLSLSLSLSLSRRLPLSTTIVRIHSLCKTPSRYIITHEVLIRRLFLKHIVNDHHHYNYHATTKSFLAIQSLRTECYAYYSSCMREQEGSDRHQHAYKCTR